MSKGWPFVWWVFVALVITWPASVGLSNDVKGPRVVFEELVHDCGTVMEGEEIEHTYKVTNQGDQPLKIVRVAPG